MAAAYQWLYGEAGQSCHVNAEALDRYLNEPHGAVISAALSDLSGLPARDLVLAANHRQNDE